MRIDTKCDLTRIFDLSGKVALITGGGGELGRTIGRGLGLAGAKIALTDIRKEQTDAGVAALRDLKVEAVGTVADAFNKDSLQSCLDEVESALGPVSILVNAAGGNIPDATVSEQIDFFELRSDAISKVVALNLFAGALIPCQVIGKRMASRSLPASIINISSMNAFRPLTRIVGYSAAKAAVSNFTQWLAVYLSRDLHSSIRVNALAPGFFLTDQNRYLLVDSQGHHTERAKTIIEHTPMGRFGVSDELIGASIWLASDASSFVTGIVLPIDGGFSAFSGV